MKNQAKLRSIISMRGCKEEVFRDVVYEWEDSIADKYGLELKKIDKSCQNKHFTSKILVKVLRKKAFPKIDETKPIDLAFITVLDDLADIKGNNILPIFIDIWEDGLELVLQVTRNLQCYFVTSYDVCQKLKQMSPETKAAYAPLCVSEKWKRSTEPVKKYDVIQVGRKNPQLHEDMLRYCESHPETEYVYSAKGGTTGTLEYISTKKGNLGPAAGRKEFMELIAASRVFLLSSPRAQNKNPDRFIDFPTPRFYESAISYCLLLGKHSGHEEFRMQGIDRVMKTYQTYGEFEEILSGMLDGRISVDKEEWDRYIEMHTAEQWFARVKQMIEEELSSHA